VPDAVVNGVRIAYDVHGSGDGSGEPLVLVCGLSQPASTWAFSILPGLVSAGYRVITFDNRGVAPSDAPPAPYTVADLAADTAALIEHLDLGPCVVAGYSLGAWVCETLAADFPHLLRAAVCIGGLNQTTEWEKVECEYGRDLAALDVPLPRLQGLMEALVYPPRAALQDDDQVRAYVEMFGSEPAWDNPGRLGQWEAAVSWTTDAGAAERRARISVPCLAVAFEHDIDAPPHHTRVAVAQVPGAQYVEIPDATHLGPFEHPDQIVAAMATFLTTLPN
jgi:pimeloyl-ACP methyl ester carboxylesterase